MFCAPDYLILRSKFSHFFWKSEKDGDEKMCKIGGKITLKKLRIFSRVRTGFPGIYRMKIGDFPGEHRAQKCANFGKNVSKKVSYFSVFFLIEIY